MDLAVSEVDHSRTFTGIIRDISDRTELQKHILEIAAEQDRRIGQELHDNVQQQLTGLGMLARSLANVLEKQARPEFGKAERLAQGLADVTKITHLLARGLIPVEIDSQGLHAALTELAENTQEIYGVECRFRGLESLTLADNFVATHLFRIAQEAITNALKHGRANTIEIVLERRAERIALVVLDNGIGINVNDKNTSGETKAIAVEVRNPSNVSNINILLEFDPNVVQVPSKPAVGIVGGQRLFEANFSEPGRVRLGFAGSTGITQDGILATIPFTATGSVGNRTPVSVRVTQANRADGPVLEAQQVSGALEIVAAEVQPPEVIPPTPPVVPPPRTFSTEDALRALQMSVKLLPEDATLDLDQNGQVSSNDARIILKRVTKN